MKSSATGLPAPRNDLPCSCGSGKLFAECCGPLLSGAQRPATAEALMRSRFTAHVAQDYAYLHRTYGPTARTPYVAEEAGEPVAWTKLTVHAHEAGANPDQAFVDFSAFFTDEEGDKVMHEKSEFLRVDGQWLFTRTVRQGPAPFKATPKVGRNDPCPCGSGKKFKQCCLGKG